MYIDGVKYTVAPAMLDCLAQAEAKSDQEAIAHLRLHKLHYEALLADAERAGNLTEDVTLLGDAAADRRGGDADHRQRVPPPRARPVGGPRPRPAVPLRPDAADHLQPRAASPAGNWPTRWPCRSRPLGPVFQAMRKQIAHRHRRPRRGTAATPASCTRSSRPRARTRSADALDKTSYVGPAPVPFADYVESIMAQTIKQLVVTRRSIRRAFEDLVITDDVVQRDRPGDQLGAVHLLLRLPRQRQDERRRAHHPAHGRLHLRPARGRGERPDHQGVRPDPAHRAARRGPHAGDRDGAQAWGPVRPAVHQGEAADDRGRRRADACRCST